MTQQLTLYRCKLCHGRVYELFHYENHGYGHIESFSEIYCENGCDTKRNFEIEEDY